MAAHDTLSSALAFTLLFAGGLALVISGNRRRRNALPDDRTARDRARNRVAAGVFLVLASSGGTFGSHFGASAVASADSQAAASARTIVMPLSVLGLQRDAAKSAKVAASLGSNEAGTAVSIYAEHGEPALTVTAVTGSFDDPGGQLQDAWRKLARSEGVHIGAGRDIEPGALGGVARCWPATFYGVSVHLCLMADRGSLLSVLDAGASSPIDAARRARTVREAVVR